MVNESTNPTQISNSLGQALQGWVTSMGAELQDISLRISKAVGIPESDDSLQKAIDEFKPETLGEAMEMASAAMEALGENPITAKLVSSLEETLGIDLRTPLQMAQMLVSGGNSPMMRIALAMFRFPQDSKTFISEAKQVLDYAKTIKNLVQSNGGDNFWRDDLAVKPLPEDIPAAVAQAKTNIIMSIKEPYNEGLYELGMAKIQEASNRLSNLQITVNVPTLAPGPVASKIAMESILDLLYRKYNSMKILSTDLTVNASTIQTTKFTEQKSAKIFAATQSAIQELRSLSIQMNTSNVVQYLYVPQYLVALNKIYNLLQYARPTVAPPPLYFPGQTFVYPGLTVQKVFADIRKLYVLATKTRRLDLFSSFIDSLEANIAQLEVEFSTCDNTINILWTYMPGLLESIQQIMSLLSDYGFMGAVNTLAAGDLGGFLSLSDMTATSDGQLWAELGKLSMLAAGLGLYNLTALLEGAIRDMRVNADQALLQSKATKNEKTAKWKKKLEATNKSIDQMVNIVATAKGVIDAVTSIIQ